MTLLGIEGEVPDIDLWDEYFAPRYGEPNREGLAAIKLLAEQEAMLLDPVYTGKAMAGLLDGLERQLFPGEGPILFVHTGGSPALFAYLITVKLGNKITSQGTRFSKFLIKGFKIFE